MTTTPMHPLQHIEKKMALNDSAKPDTSGKKAKWIHPSKPKEVKKKITLPDLFQNRKFLLY